MKATDNTDTQKVSVKYCRIHYNHSTQLAYIRIPQRVRLDIASKLQLRVSIECILDDIHDSVQSRGVSREHVIISDKIFIISKRSIISKALVGIIMTLPVLAPG